jgi:two-component sensor histidine kinase
MALHELATNASKYGALSGAKGVVRLSWRVDARGAGRRLAVSWVERGGPRIAPPEREGFGRVVTERMVAAALDAEVSVDYAPEGFAWRMICGSGALAGA